MTKKQRKRKKKESKRRTGSFSICRTYSNSCINTHTKLWRTGYVLRCCVYCFDVKNNYIAGRYSSGNNPRKFPMKIAGNLMQRNKMKCYSSYQMVKLVFLDSAYPNLPIDVSQGKRLKLNSMDAHCQAKST